MTNLQNKLFLQVLKDSGIPLPVPEFRFHPKRKWRFDFCWPDRKVAVEIEGGVWLQTEEGRSKGHAHPKRFFSDMEKYTHAAVLGWRILRFTPNQSCLRSTTALIKQALGL